MSDFRVEVFTGSGPVTMIKDVSNVRITSRVNQIGECEFTIPAGLAAQIAADKGRRYRLYHSELGYLGVFVHNDMTTDADQKTATIRAHDELIDLANALVGFGRVYNEEQIQDVLDDLLGIDTDGFGPDWIAVLDEPSTDTINLAFQGETYLRALDVIRQYLRGWFRLDGESMLRFGFFTNTTPDGRLFAPAVGSAEPILNTSDIPQAIITSLKRERRGSGVVNRVYPFGAGLGETQIDLRYSTRNSPYTIQDDDVGNSEQAFYIEDAASVAAYGRVMRTMPYPDIRPITNSEADLENAANALYDIATAFLQRYRNPQNIYTISCVGLDMAVRPGSPILVNFHGVAELETGKVAYITLDDELFYVTAITRDFGDSGAAIAEVTVSSTGEEIVGTTEVVTGLIDDIGKFKMKLQPSMTYYTKSSPTLPIDPTRYVDFTFYIGSEVLLINEMRVEFRLMPLRTYASTTDTAPSTADTSGSGGGSTPTTSTLGTTHSHSINVNASPSGSNRALYIDDGLNLNTNGVGSGVSTATQATNDGHTHTVTIAAHTHSVTIPSHNHALQFGVTDDAQTPQTVTVEVNGASVGDIVNADTGAVVGSSVSGAGLYLVDILAAITVTDFRERTHTIRFECGSQRGQIYAQLLSRVTIQPIAAT